MSLNHKQFDTDFPAHLDCFAQPIVEKETFFYGILVVFRSKNIKPGSMAHEADHVAQLIWKRISEDLPGIEADAYLVEWIVDCIDQVRTNKFK